MFVAVIMDVILLNTMVSTVVIVAFQPGTIAYNTAEINNWLARLPRYYCSIKEQPYQQI